MKKRVIAIIGLSAALTAAVGIYLHRSQAVGQDPAVKPEEVVSQAQPKPLEDEQGGVVAPARDIVAERELTPEALKLKTQLEQEQAQSLKEVSDSVDAESIAGRDLATDVVSRGGAGEGDPSADAIRELEQQQNQEKL